MNNNSFFAEMAMDIIEVWGLLFRVAAVSQILLSISTTLQSKRQDSAGKIYPYLGLCIVIYLLIPYATPLKMTTVFVVLVGATKAIPLLLWLMAEAIFTERFKLTKKHLHISVATLTPSLLSFVFFVHGDSSLIWAVNLSVWLPRVFSLSFAYLTIRAAFKERATDLVEARRSFRVFLITVIGLLVTVISVVEIYLAYSPVYWRKYLELANVAFIFSLTFLFNLKFLAVKEESFFASPVPPTPSKEKQDQPLDRHHVLATRIEDAMVQSRLFEREGLSIGQLAKEIKAQEHQVRRAINGVMGYRNFNDFLNQYRIAAASELLKNPDLADQKILAVALTVGFRSLTPFNKAFRESHGMTPSQFRKSHQK